MTPSPAEAAFLKARLTAAEVRRSREGAVVSCAERLLPPESGAIQAALMQGAGSAAAIGGSLLPFGGISWLLMSPSGCLGASAAWHTLVWCRHCCGLPEQPDQSRCACDGNDLIRCFGCCFLADDNGA